ncbi:hypothetical protein EB796_009142 [Bugula neritina]|uniref:Pyridoxal phosphate homeostasis protein n=1 Tax=Bugula neritina TaxID=10212 RepID=A0A7J7K3I5_BUGNE|nr:hypothetical protein EB796_009142 [Bugula neritina]
MSGGICKFLKRVMSTASSNSNLVENLSSVKDRVASSAAKRTSKDNLTLLPRLVCVGKTKPASDIQLVYDAGQRHFGENYVNEIVEKSHDLQETCPDIKWHFIGRLQSNKVGKLLGCPNLSLIETIDSEKLADRVDKLWVSSERYSGTPLNVMVQINTSNEEQKSGVSTEKALDLVEHVMVKCENLHFTGVMTIGSFSHDYSTGPNPDFLTLLQCKEKVMEKFSLSSDDVEVSMGMSNDFEHAIELGSTNVRVGSTIFGAREYASKPS